MAIAYPPARAPSSKRTPNRTAHQTVCDECNMSATLPFRPTLGKPVYCRSCFKARRQGTSPAASADSSQPAQTTRRRSESKPAVDSAPVGDATFSEMSLDATTKTAISRMNISRLTPIQEKAIPHLMAGRDLIGQARTGSGKTLAFAVPLAEMCDPTVRQVQAVVLVPTRELAMQLAGVIQDLVSLRKIRVTLLYGGRALKPEYAALKNGAQVVIGTPGRTLDHLRQRTLDLSGVRFLVLDEADEMLDRGFAPDVEAIIARTPKGRQTALLSATMPEWVSRTASKHLRNPVTVEVDAGLQAPPSVEHLVYTIQKSDKLEALRTLLDGREDAPVLVFGKTKRGVKQLARQLDSLGYPVGALQGNLSQNAREQVIKGFRSGAAPILVATNVAARGLDFEGIGQVINYDLPDSELLFTHRVGRTGRMGRSGEAVTFITEGDERKWREIERDLGMRFVRKPWKKVRKAMALQ